ncbi:hypothetical protein NXS08_00640 [Gleimia sp. 6138-11-ORH1]|uniref:hypothetical protein n=1 Tax=Gleimia sp. 6138-11-ORH1 TaxID=2973937 RepID=UPI00216A8D77|nr:hypothetical protein [Gleimia sp. 6138-11-ORH1]MCS4483999.1 hypothetical protein [Gleimia sp. 6138-11-ORH1]
MHNNEETANIDDANEKLDPNVTDNAEDAEDGIRHMTLKELQEAYEDESHPRYEEAMVETKLISEQLTPSLEALRKTVGHSVDLSGIIKKMIPVAEQLGSVSLNAGVADIFKNAIPKPNLPSTDLLNPTYEPPVFARYMPNLDVDSLRMPDYKGLLESIAESSRVNEKRAQRQLETLEAMSAVLMQTQTELERQHKENKESASINTNLVRWTLIATVAGIVIGATVTVITSLM